MKNLSPKPNFKRAQGGFTLIELMVVVAIVGILAAIAYPSYLSYVVKTRRSTAGACLMEMAQWMERNYTTCLAYNKTGTSCGTAVTTAALPALACKTDLTNSYTITLTESPATPAISATTFQLKATPSGSQATSDTKCGTLKLDQTGTKTASATSGCWN